MILINNVFVFIAIFYLFVLAKIFNEKKFDNFLTVFFLLLITIIYGFRFTSQSADFMDYYHMAQKSFQSSWSMIMNGEKFFNRWFAKGVMEITHDAQYYFLFTSFITTAFLLYFSFEYFSDKVFFLLCYFTIIPAIQNNIVRQFLGMAILYISLSFFFKSKKILFFLFSFCSVLIHSSCIFFTPLFILSYIKVTKNVIIIYAIVVVSLIVFHNSIISFFQLFLFSDYVGDAYGLNSSNPAHLLEILFPLIALFLIKSNKCTFAIVPNNEKIINVIEHGTILYAICIIMSTFFILMFYRIALLFFPLALLCIDSVAQRNPSRAFYLKMGMSTILIALFFATDKTPSFFLWEKIPPFSWL